MWVVVLILSPIFSSLLREAEKLSGTEAAGGVKHSDHSSLHNVHPLLFPTCSTVANDRPSFFNWLTDVCDLLLHLTHLTREAKAECKAQGRLTG